MGGKGWLQSVGTLVRTLWCEAGSGASAPPLAALAHPVGNLNNWDSVLGPTRLIGRAAPLAAA